MLVLKVREGNTWKDLDLYGNESINFNKSVLEVQEFEKRSSDFTKTFRIPGTAFNNRVMGNIFKINLEDSSFDPKQSLECAITNSGNVIIVGSLRLERMYVNVGKVDYEIVVYSQVGSLASTTAENTLCDLDFSEYTHSLSYENISDSWDLDLFSGDIVYPFIHYGYDDEDIIPDIEFTSTFYSFDNSNNALPYWYYKPAIRVNKVVEKIINESGYELESNFMATDDFNNIYMPLSFSAEMGVQTIEDVSFNATTSTVNAIPNGDNNVIFDIEVSDTSNNYNNATGEYTFDREGIFSFRVDYTLSTTDCCEYEGDPYYHLYDRFVRNRGGFITVFQDRFLGYQCNVTNVPFRKDITMQVGPGSDWQIGDKISFGTSKVVEDCNSYTITSNHNTHSDIVYYECEDETTPITLRVNTGSPVTICANPEIPPVFTVHTGTIVDNGPCASIHPCDATIGFLSQFLLYKTPFEPSTGSDVVISKNMNCDITQLDFLKGIFKHYNMVVVPDVDDPVKLIIEPWNNWVNDPNVVTRDWTQYLDTGKDVKVQPLVDNDNRFVKLFDEEDGDKYNTLYQDNQNQIFGEVLFDADTQILSNLKEVDTIFSPTPSDGVDGNPNFIIPHLYEEDDAGNKSVFATNPRLLYYNGMITTPDNYFVRDENNVNHSLYAYPCMSISQDLKGSSSPNDNLRVLSWNSVNNYYSQLTGYNTSNMLGSYYNLYWKDYFVDIYDSNSRLITAYFNLPFQEFAQTKLNDKIQISGLFGNTQWRINRIIDYDLMDPGRTKVELTKILQEPEPIGETRTYLLERCDTQVELLANYNSFEPLTIGSSVKTDNAPFEDICYEITKVYKNETYERYYTEYHTLGSGNLPRPYVKSNNIVGDYTWNWTFNNPLGNTFEVRYGTNGLSTDGTIIYNSGNYTGTGTYSFDNPNGLNIESYIYYPFIVDPGAIWEYTLTIDLGPQPSPPTTSTDITEVYEDCEECTNSNIVSNTYLVEPAYLGFNNYDYNSIYDPEDGTLYNSRHYEQFGSTINENGYYRNGSTTSSTLPVYTFEQPIDTGVGTGLFVVNLKHTWSQYTTLYEFKEELIYDGQVVDTYIYGGNNSYGSTEHYSLQFNKTSSYPRRVDLRLTISRLTYSYVNPEGETITDNGDGTWTWPGFLVNRGYFFGDDRNFALSHPDYQQWLSDIDVDGFGNLSTGTYDSSGLTPHVTCESNLVPLEVGSLILLDNPPSGYGKYVQVIEVDNNATPTLTGIRSQTQKHPTDGGTKHPTNDLPHANSYARIRFPD